MNLRRTRAVARKELLHIVRDARSLTMALAVPLLMLLLFGYALTLDVDRIPTLIYDEDQTPESRTLQARLQGSRYFEILGNVDNYKSIELAIDRGHCLLAVVIPRHYARKILAGSVADVQVLVDGSDSNTAAVSLGYAEALLQAHSMEIRVLAYNRRASGTLRLPVEGRLRVWYNSEIKSKNYIVPGMIAVILMIIAALLTSLTIAREWEMGTMEQLLSTPLRPAELVLGKLAAFFGIGLIDTAVSIGVGVFLFEVPLRGSLWLLAFTSCIFLFGAMCWGILLSALTRSQLQAYQMGMLTSFLPAFMLSGFIYAIENMPVVIQIVTYIFPTRYFVTVLKGIFLKGVGLEILWGEIAFLIAFAALVFLLSTQKLKQKLA
ncbi:MAG: ABC transporter permease [Acidobacteria bacterium]|nr:ABC transporter permease [Acidobacteriota bacterium]MBI3654816.1 ABC transporter permease [Acidobacteriota bacterium]